MRRMHWRPRQLEALILGSVALLNCGTVVAQVLPTAPPPNRNITAPGAQRPASPQPERQPSGARAAQPTRQMQSIGTIEGFVYWDANSIVHKPADNCSGLAITVSVGSSSGGPLTAYTPLGTLSNNFKYVGQVKQFLAGGKINVYAVCTYGFDHVPVGPNLQVKLTVTDPFAFSPYVVPQSGTLGPIQIINGQCNMLPKIVNPTASDLFAHWGSCQNMAYGVNFPMQVPVRVSTGAGGVTPVGSGGQAGMLSGAPQQGMLGPGTTQSAHPQGTSSTLLGNRQVMPSEGTKPSGTSAARNALEKRPAGSTFEIAQWPPMDPPIPGTISGFVYWDTRGTQHTPPASCSGLTLTVMLGNGASPREQFKKLGDFTNNFTYLDRSPQNTNNSLIYTPEWLGVCAYVLTLPQSFVSSKGPDPKDVAVKVTVNSSAFSTKVTPIPNAPKPIRLTDQICPLLDSPAVLFPGGKPESCHQIAFNIDFALQGPGRALQFAPSTAPASVSGTRDQLLASPSATAAFLSNTDVINLEKAGIPETTIISKIKSAQKKFDFSPASCRELQAAHVTRQVLDAMGDGSVRPCATISGNAAQLTGSRNAVLNLDAPKALKKITNPRLSELSAGIIAVLQQQHQAAQQESAEIKLRPANTTASLTRVPTATGFKGGAPAQGIGPETVQGAQGNLSSSITHAPSLNTTVLTCTYDPTPRILQVSGGQSHGVFTPEAKYNLYTIVGCSFGQSQSGNSAYIFGANGFKANLNIDYWSDNGITAHLDPYLAGVLDQSNVTLIVAPAGKQQLQKPGFQFYAARGMPAPDGSDQEVQLVYNSLPQSNVAFEYSNAPIVIGWNLVPSNAQSKFPSFSFSGTPVIGWVFRYAYGHEDPHNPCFINDVHYPLDDCRWYFQQTHTGSDTWDFRKLAPGFAISSYNLYYETIDPSKMCGAWDDEASGDKDGQVGQWNFNLNSQNQISVAWPLYYCHDEEEFSSRINKQVLSSYGLAVWVLGPRCVDPWNAQKDQACIDQIRKMLS